MSMRFRVEYSPEAFDDLRAIYSYIAFHLKERETAKALVARIRREIRALNDLPERFALVDWEPWTSLGLRKLPVDRYVVFYLTDPTERLVRIVRIFYGGRDIEALIRRDE